MQTTDSSITLSAQGLCKSYVAGKQQQQVLDQLNLTLRAGEIVALVGSSGSGKTSLLNLLSGIDTPDRGSVAIMGTDLYRQGEPQRTMIRRTQMGFVFQFFNLIPTLTVAENIALPLELIGKNAAAQRSASDYWLQQVGLPHTADRYPETLSGGEQQRIAIARALVHTPPLLLADEPTGNLDEQTGQHIMAILIQLARQQATSLLIVTHSRQVADQADRILHLRRGRLQQDT